MKGEKRIIIGVKGKRGDAHRTERGFKMANTKNTLTQAQALAYLIEHADANTPADVMAKARELYAAKVKKYDRPRTISKERRANEALVPAVVALVKSADDGELVNATWINDHFDHVDVRSPQKARVIAEIAIERGELEKFTHKGRTYYRAI